MGEGQKCPQEQTGPWPDLLLHTGPRPPAHFPCSPRAPQGSCSSNPFLPVSFPAPVSGCGWWGGNGRHGQLGAVLSHALGGAYPTCSARGRGALKRWTFVTKVNTPPTKRPVGNPSA